MYKNYQPQLNSISVLEKELSQWGDLISRFFCESPKMEYPPFGSYWPALERFLRSPLVAEMDLGQIDFEKAQGFSMVGRHEFEGALINHLLCGGVYGTGWPSRPMARQQAAQVIDELYPYEDDCPQVFKLPREWCEWSDYWAITWTYIAWEPKRRHWWLLSFGSTS